MKVNSLTPRFEKAKAAQLTAVFFLGFSCTFYVLWHRSAVSLEANRREYATTIIDDTIVDKRLSKESSIQTDSCDRMPLNIDLESALNCALPKSVLDILSAYPFSEVPFLPLNVSVIDRLLGIHTMRFASPSAYKFGLFPDDWVAFRTAIFRQKSSDIKNCRLVDVCASFLFFRCFVEYEQDIILYKLYKESNYFITRPCGNYSSEQRMAFKMTTFSSHVLQSNASVYLPHDLILYQSLLRHSNFLVCDYKAADEYQTTYGKKFNKNNTLVQVPESSVAGLSKLQDLLHALRMTPFLCAGTLLGWRRECGIIMYTSDFDLCVPISQYNEGLESIMQSHSQFRLRARLGKPSDLMEYVVYDNEVRMDIFFVYEALNESWVGSMGPEFMKLRYIYPKITQLCTVDLLGYLFHAPCNVDEIVTADYGPNWLRPLHQDNYSWWSTPHNVKNMGFWPDEDKPRVQAWWW